MTFSIILTEGTLIPADVDYIGPRVRELVYTA
jgi:hypothetical protein